MDQLSAATNRRPIDQSTPAAAALFADCFGCSRVVLCCGDLVLSAAAAATYCVYAVSADVVVFVASIQHSHTLEVAFIAGAVVMASGVASLSLARRYALPIHLPPLYKQCLRRVRADDNVKRMIGRRLAVGPQAASHTLVPSSPAQLSSAAFVPGFRVVNCLSPGPRWHRVPSATYWYDTQHTPTARSLARRLSGLPRSCRRCVVLSGAGRGTGARVELSSWSVCRESAAVA